MEETIEPSVQEETQESTGLLDGATAEPEESTEVNPQAVEIDHRDPDEVKAKQSIAKLGKPSPKKGKTYKSQKESE